MLLKVFVSALMVFAGSVGVLRASVVTENYLLLVAGLALAVTAVLLGLRPSDGARLA